MSRWVIVATAIALTACVSGERTSGVDEEILGVWEMVSFTIDGDPIDVEVGVNSASMPYLDVGEDTIEGSLGCNSMRSIAEEPFSFHNGVLLPGEHFLTAIACLPEELMQAEEALAGDLALDSIEVTVDEDSMTWTGDGESIVWRRLDEVPSPPTLPPQTSVGALDCGQDVVVSQDFPSDDTTAGEVARRTDGVVSVEEGERGLRATGYDADGKALVVVAFQDVDPFPYRVYTCP